MRAASRRRWPPPPLATAGRGWARRRRGGRRKRGRGTSPWRGPPLLRSRQQEQQPWQQGLGSQQQRLVFLLLSQSSTSVLSVLISVLSVRVTLRWERNCGCVVPTAFVSPHHRPLHCLWSCVLSLGTFGVSTGCGGGATSRRCSACGVPSERLSAHPNSTSGGLASSKSASVGHITTVVSTTGRLRPRHDCRLPRGQTARGGSSRGGAASRS